MLGLEDYFVNNNTSLVLRDITSGRRVIGALYANDLWAACQADVAKQSLDP